MTNATLRNKTRNDLFAHELKGSNGEPEQNIFWVFELDEADAVTESRGRFGWDAGLGDGNKRLVCILGG